MYPSQQQERLDDTTIIRVLEPLREVNAKLLELVEELRPEDWQKPTTHLDRDVKALLHHGFLLPLQNPDGRTQ